MGTIPVANPSPLRQLGLPRRGLRLFVLLFAVLMLMSVGIGFAWPTGSKVDQTSWFNAGAASEFAVNKPVRFREHHFWLVKLNDRHFQALLTRDPHLGCTIPWRPDFEFGGKTGWFRNPCHNETYDLTGRCFFGPCLRGMDRYTVKVQGDNVLVDTDAVELGPALGPEYSSCPQDDPNWIVNCVPPPGSTESSINP
jgi:nitrite reductase/ring-hydroxylating ferredoxin subunit